MKLTVTKTSKKSDSISATFDVKDSTTVEELKELVSKECESDYEPWERHCTYLTAN